MHRVPRKTLMMSPARSAAALLNRCGLCLMSLLIATQPSCAAAEDSGTPTPQAVPQTTATGETASAALKTAGEWMDALLEGGIREVAGDAWPAELDFDESEVGTPAGSPRRTAHDGHRGTSAGFSSSSASVASNELAITTAANSGNRILKTIEEQFPLMVFGVVCAAGICAVSWLTKP